MRQWKTSQCTIYNVGAHKANAYLIVTKSHNILVDTSTNGAYKALKKKVKKALQKAFSIDYLILTHTHYDHCQNAARIKQETGARLFMHTKESDSFKTGYTKLPEGTNNFADRITRIGDQYLKKRFGYESVDIDQVISDDDMELEKSIRILHTPGHTAGSISIIVDDEIALIGDTAFGIFNVIFPPFADDQKVLLDSWVKLLNQECKLFLPGHGRAITKDEFQKEFVKRKKILLGSLPEPGV